MQFHRTVISMVSWNGAYGFVLFILSYKANKILQLKQLFPYSLDSGMY